MKTLAIALFLVSAAPAIAEEAPKPPAKPVCGKTVDECQKKLDAAQVDIQKLQMAVTGLQQQRNANASALADSQLQAFILSQAPAAK